MDKKKMMITAGVMAGVGYGMYRYFKKNPVKLNMMKQKMKNIGNAVNNFEDEMMLESCHLFDCYNIDIVIKFK